MAEVMLKRDWPAAFRRTVGTGRSLVRMVFEPGVPVEVNQKQFESLKADIGIALLPCERDEKGRARAITDAVDMVGDSDGPDVN